MMRVHYFDVAIVCTIYIHITFKVILSLKTSKTKYNYN